LKAKFADDRGSFGVKPLCEDDRYHLTRFDGFVCAIPRNMTGLLAPVTNLGLGGLVTITANVSQTTTVIALLALGAIFCHVAYKVR